MLISAPHPWREAGVKDFPTKELKMRWDETAQLPKLNQVGNSQTKAG